MQLRDKRRLYTLICTKTTAPVLTLVVETLAEIQADHLQPLDWLFHCILSLFVEIDCLAEHFDMAPDWTRTAGTLSKALIQYTVSSSHLRTFFWHKNTTHLSHI